MLLALAAVLSTMHYEADVAVDGGDYVDVLFEVPAGTREIQIKHDDGSDFDILDWGVWSPEGFRGWGGGNTEDIVIGVEQSSRSYLPGPITPGTWRVTIGKAKLDADGGHYTIDVICRDDVTLAVRPKATFMPVVLEDTRRWYKGDFHVHSAESGDATASFEQIATLAKQRGLDFVNLSDHNTSSHLDLAAAAQPMYGDVLFLRGAEITTYRGHGNAVGLSTYVDHRIGYQGVTIESMLEAVESANALFIVNHPTLDLGDNCIGCAWDHPTTPWARVAGIEILTGPWEVVERLFAPRAIALWDELLGQGYRIAAIGGSDDHRAGTGTSLTDSPIGSPTTLVLADNLSEAAIMEGIRKGRTIVQLRGPDDPLVDMRIGDAEIGDEITADTARVAVSVTGGSGMFVQLWKNGEKLEQRPITSDDFKTTFDDDTEGGGRHRYRVELINDANNRIVVTSHIYVNAPPLTGFVGCCDGGAGAGVLLAAPVLGLLLRRRRRAT
ncbi:MAG: CehA/McbA family metallohydrolase [Deltaproteobacteria bacterium]|nr:CehA/McbA family metallohydrolase [Deltaproteobacteria bacterium]MDQ3298769.1 CehA/McbA family metallohydrolase [Myxococcota bacterium]